MLFIVFVWMSDALINILSFLTSHHCWGNSLRLRGDSAHSQCHGAFIVVILRALEHIDSICTTQSSIYARQGHGQLLGHGPGRGTEVHNANLWSCWKKYVCKDILLITCGKLLLFSCHVERVLLIFKFNPCYLGLSERCVHWDRRTQRPPSPQCQAPPSGF